MAKVKDVYLGKLEVVDIEEQKDGSAILTVEFDTTFRANMAKAYGLKTISDARIKKELLGALERAAKKAQNENTKKS